MGSGTQWAGTATSREEDADKRETGASGSGDRKDVNASEGSADSEKQAPAQDENEDASQRVARAEAEKEEALRIARAAHADAQSAKAYVATLTATLKDSAEKIAINRDRAASGEEEQTLAERLQEDPEAVLEEHYNRRTAPLVRQNLETQARLSRELAVTRLSNTKLWDGGPSVWEKYGAEADDFLNKFPDPSARATPDAYDAAIRWVRAQHIDEEYVERAKSERELERRSFVEAPSSGGPSGGRQRKQGLSDVERAVAKGLGIQEEEYIRYKEGA